MTLEEAIGKLTHYWFVGMDDYFTSDEINDLIKMLQELAERREQVAFGIIRRHCEDKNKIEAIAKLFGKELGEEFIINDFDMKFKAKFEKDGMYHMVGARWIPSCLFEKLILGKAVIVSD